LADATVVTGADGTDANSVPARWLSRVGTQSKRWHNRWLMPTSPCGVVISPNQLGTSGPLVLAVLLLSAMFRNRWNSEEVCGDESHGSP